MRNEAHPLLIEDILPANVRGHVSTDRVSNVLGSVRIELTTGITVGNVDLCSIPEPVDLDILVSLDKLKRSNMKMNKVQGSSVASALGCGASRARSGVCAYVSRLNGSVRNQPGTIPGLRAVGNDDRLDVSDQRVWAGLGGSVNAKVVDRVEGDETRVRGLVDNRTGLSDFGPLRRKSEEREFHQGQRSNY